MASQSQAVDTVGDTRKRQTRSRKKRATAGTATTTAAAITGKRKRGTAFDEVNQEDVIELTPERQTTLSTATVTESVTNSRDNQQAGTESSSTARTTRSKRRRAYSSPPTSILAPGSATSSLPTLEPSTKSLGKRRAVSPIAVESGSATPVSLATDSISHSGKKRRISLASSLTSTAFTPSPAYNLRPRAPSGNSPASTFESDKFATPSANMARKSRGSHTNGHGNSNSLRAKAAANAAITAHNAASSSSHAARANQSTAPNGAASMFRRQRDPRLDVNDLMGVDDAVTARDVEDDDEDDGVDENEDDEQAQGNYLADEEAAEIRRAMENIEAAEAVQEDTGSASDIESLPLLAIDGEEAVVHSSTTGSIGDSGEVLPPLPQAEDELDFEEQEEEARHLTVTEDEDDDDIDEDDEIGAGADGDVLEDEFDAPLTFDADGNPLPSDTTTVAGGENGLNIPGNNERSGPSEPGSNASSERSSDLRPLTSGGLATAKATAENDGFTSFAASLRGYSGLMANMSSRLRTLLTNLRNKVDASVRMIALQELSELLSISTEDTLAGYFQVDAFVKELVACLKGQGVNPQADYALIGEMNDDDGLAIAQAIAASGDASGGSGAEANAEEMQLLACRCLANLIEAMPTTSHNIVSNGAIPVLCSKLFEITFIDLAEQTISTLEKLSEEVPGHIVREGGLTALLTYLDFFSTHVQRTALTAAANCCHNLSINSFTSVRDVIPILRNVLSYADRKLVEQACLAITGVVESYRHHPDKLEVLLTADLLTAIAALLVPGSANSTIDSSTHPKILKLLATAAKSSPEIAISLIEMNVANTLYQLLTGINPPMDNEGVQGIKKHLEEDDMLVLNNLVHRSKDVVQETLNLIYELLPALPRDGIFDSRAHMHRTKAKVKKEETALGSSRAGGDLLSTISDITTSSARPFSSPHRSSNRSPNRSGRSTPKINDDGSISVKREELTPALDLDQPITSTSSTHNAFGNAVRARESAQERRVELLTNLKDGDGRRKETVNRFFALLLPILLEVYTASVGIQIRTKTFQSMLKIVQYCDQEHLPTILIIVPMAGFLASCFSSRDQPTLIIDALQMTELLLSKVPDAYQYYFRREGVMHEIERMAEEPLVTPPKPKKGASSSTSTPGASAPPTPVTGTATPADDGGDSADLGTRLVPLVFAGIVVTAKPLSPNDAMLKDSITLRSKYLKKMLTVSTTSDDGSHKADSALTTIRRLVEILERVTEHAASVAAAKLKAKQAMQNIATLFACDEAMSSFEMQESGLIGGLLRFAMNGRNSILSNEIRRHIILDAFMGTSGAGEAAFASFIKRLQEALGRAEESDVVTALPSGGDSRQNPATMLARQLKIRLVAAENSGIPKSVSNVVVSIHAIATFQAFNDYLRPRIFTAIAAEERSKHSPAPSPGMNSSASSRLTGVLAAFAAATGMPSPDVESATAALADSSTNESSSTAAPGSSSTSRPSAQPARRRSSRLSARANATNGLAAASPSASSSSNQHVVVKEQEQVDETALACGDSDDASDVVDEGLDASQAGIEERPVNFEVADDGSRINASTPDGTRIQTPIPGSNAPLAPSLSRLASSILKVSSSPASTATPPVRSYAAALKSAPADWHLEFSMNGRDVNLDTTIFGAVYQHELRSRNQTGDRGIWQTVYTVTFKKVLGPPPVPNIESSPEPPNFETTLPDFLEKDPQQATILRLLGVLHQINYEWADTYSRTGGNASGASAAVPSSLFVNNKLTAKLNRQLEEPMIVASKCLPDWALELPAHFPFLFPFETRFVFLQSTSFGYARLMQKWLQSARTDANSRRDENLSFLGRLQRQKVRISRQRLFESAYKVFELYGSSKAMLEVEYFDEVGTGLGPTLEFYSLVSKEFRRKTLGLWRESDSSSDNEYISHPSGLFPAPLDSMNVDAEIWTKRCTTFKILGTVVAKALMDSRIIDIPFNQFFMKLVLNQHIPMNVASIKMIDPALAQSLEHLDKYLIERSKIEMLTDVPEEDKKVAISAIEIDGASVEDLSLDFTLPGYELELKDRGKNIAVTMSNLEEYLSLVIEWTLIKGIKPMVQKFKEGFTEVFSVHDLHTFTPQELVMLFGNEDEDWSIENISESIKADHGYSLSSTTLINLVSIISTFDKPLRRNFLSFATGASRLPTGGFSGLNPRLTVVRKLPEGGNSADSVLPSVMTCANFLKIPDYSSKEVLEERLVKAIEEGSGAFHLS